MFPHAPLTGLALRTKHKQDSLCLARLLLDLAPVLGLRLTVAHCDHRMRPDSAACAAYVRGWAAAQGLACVEAAASAPLHSEVRQCTAGRPVACLEAAQLLLCVLLVIHALRTHAN
jgi:hypothetical protein